MGGRIRYLEGCAKTRVVDLVPNTCGDNINYLELSGEMVLAWYSITLVCFALTLITVSCTQDRELSIECNLNN